MNLMKRGSGFGCGNHFLYRLHHGYIYKKGTRAARLHSKDIRGLEENK